MTPLKQDPTRDMLELFEINVLCMSPPYPSKSSKRSFKHTSMHHNFLKLVSCPHVQKLTRVASSCYGLLLFYGTVVQVISAEDVYHVENMTVRCCAPSCQMPL